MYSTLRGRKNSFAMASLARMALNPNQRRNFRSYIERASARVRGRRPAGRAQTATLRKQTTYRSGILGGTNADQRMIYRRKRMPKRRRKSWVRFVKKVNAVDEKDLGSQTILINDQIVQKQGILANGSQACLTLALYPFFNGTNGWLNDMRAIHDFDNAANPTAVAGTTTYGSTKFLFQSAVMDCTLRNTSLKYGEAGASALAPEAAIELDIYTLQTRKEFADRGLRFVNFTDLCNSYDDNEIGGTGDGFNIQDRGASPFEFGAQLARFGVRILKKQKFFIPNGQTITFQTRDPKRHVIMKDQLKENDGFVKPGVTQVYYLIYKLVPGLVQGTAPGEYVAAINLGVTRKYRYKVEGRSEARERSTGSSYSIDNKQ